MNRFKGNRGMFFLIISIILVLIAYYLLSNTSTENEKDRNEIVKISVAESLLLRDLENDYPPSPKEVVKYYSEITKAFYDDIATEDELTALAIKSREVLDAELISNATEEQYLEGLLAEITLYKDANKKVSSYTISNSVDVEYFLEDGYEFARLYAHYTLMINGDLQTIDEIFILRKDDEEHWKIYGWDLEDK